MRRLLFAVPCGVAVLLGSSTIGLTTYIKTCIVDGVGQTDRVARGRATRHPGVSAGGTAPQRLSAPTSPTGARSGRLEADDERGTGRPRDPDSDGAGASRV